MVEGNNTTGNCILAHAIYCDASHPLPQTSEKQIAVYNESEGAHAEMATVKFLG